MSRSDRATRLRGTGLFRRLWRDRRGVSAIEFAIITPAFLMPLYFGAVEMGFALTAERRVATVAGAAADLVAQTDKIDDAALEDILDISALVMQPLPSSGMSIVLTSVLIDEDENITVDWSKARGGTAYGRGSSMTLPAGLDNEGGVIIAEVSYPYTIPVIGTTYTLQHTFYAAPRMGVVCNSDVTTC